MFYYTGITIGFERISYTFSEEILNPSVRDKVFIIKQNNQTSELTYDITIETFMGTALNNIDFQASTEIVEAFTPRQQRIPVNFRILPDEVPEGIEIFTFQLRNNNPDTTFINDPQETTISIIDTDSKCCTYRQVVVHMAGLSACDSAWKWSCVSARLDHSACT